MIKIEQCKEVDVEQLLEFIDKYWKKDHIFVLNRWIFDFQHKNNDSYNFIIAKDDHTDEIAGIFGFIPTSHYDNTLKETDDNVWGAIWKVREDLKVYGTGLMMLKKLTKQYVSYGAIGLSADAVRMYKALNYTTGVVNQYYVLNPSCSNFNIANIVSSSCNESKSSKTNNCLISPIELNETIEIEGLYSPRKSVKYLINRYSKHKIYKYDFLGVSISNVLKIILVTRTIKVANSKCIRVVDVLGDLGCVKGLGYAIENYISTKCKDIEYVDLMNWGIKQEIFTDNGFKILNPSEGNIIIPNYFEPFEKRNIVLTCGHNSTDPNYVFFKGDADQDRPNIINYGK